MKNNIENPAKKTVKTVDGMVGWGQIDNRQKEWTNLTRGMDSLPISPYRLSHIGTFHKSLTIF